VQQQQQDCEGF